MRIEVNNNIEMVTVHKTNSIKDALGVKRSQFTHESTKNINEEAQQTLDNSEETKGKLKEAVDMMNEILEANNNASKFTYHEGLDRYYVSVINRETEEVVKEIPPKKLLDAFYELQKMVGMIVDEKI